jgi:flagellar basal body rod protein FlgG
LPRNDRKYRRSTVIKERKIKKYVLAFKFVGIVMMGIIFLSSDAGAYTDEKEVLDNGLANSMAGLRAFQVHYTNFSFYTINMHTPGFIETGVYNTRRADTKKVEYVPFFRWRSGPIVETGRPLDFYIDAASRGFFVVKLPSSLGYTRDGRFFIDSQRRLVTLSGTYPVMGDDGEIIFPEQYDSVTISKAGTLYVDGVYLSRLKTAVFKSKKDMQTMNSLNGSFFVLTQELELLEGDEHYSITQGHLEQNNVLKAITGDILMAKNAYDVNAKAAHLLNRVVGNGASLITPSQ